MKIEKYGQHILDKTNKFEVKKKKKVKQRVQIILRIF